MLKLYKSVMNVSAPLLRRVLRTRCRRGKEDPERLGERMGVAGAPRPKGLLIWFHAASVGEAQSTLILIKSLQARLPEARFLVTTGTVTSAQLMQQRLPQGALHQYFPLDHPAWVRRFLDHWQPDLVFWMESELWPNMLGEIRDRGIPAALINARLSRKSFERWKLARSQIIKLLAAFRLLLTQTEEDAAYFRALGNSEIIVGDNLKYAADPLPCDARDLEVMEKSLQGRPVWVYASTHEGEEELAARLHSHLRKKIPGLLTVIVPRHPERGEAIRSTCSKYSLNIRLRGSRHILPQPEDDIYIADTLGELGLFYRLSPIACIGRSFSNDGGGGHNPIEAAQLDCAVLHGPHVQNLAQIYGEMNEAGVALRLKDEKDFQNRLEKLLTDTDGLSALQNRAASFTRKKSGILDRLMETILPWAEQARANREREQKCA